MPAPINPESSGECPGRSWLLLDPTRQLRSHRIYVFHPLRYPLLIIDKARQIARRISVTGQLNNVFPGGTFSSTGDRVDNGVKGHTDGHDEGPLLEVR